MTSALRGEEGFLKADGCTEKLCECDSDMGDDGIQQSQIFGGCHILSFKPHPGNMEEAGHVIAAHVGS